jgi:hypothetical protein
VYNNIRMRFHASTKLEKGKNQHKQNVRIRFRISNEVEERPLMIGIVGGKTRDWMNMTLLF